MNRSFLFPAGVVVGAVGMALAGWLLMPSLMISVQPSRFGFDETVSTLERATEAKGWKLAKVYDIQQSLQKAGHANMTRASVISLCQPDHAYRILHDDANKRVLGVMPCRIGVYEANDGQTYLAGMNIGLMGRMFGGTIAEVMGDAAADEHEIIASVVE